jgi:hypothetical protein
MNDTATPVAAAFATALDAAVTAESTVTVTKTDGKTYTGVPKPHPTEPGQYVIRTGRRGRPAVIHPDDIDEVIFE